MNNFDFKFYELCLDICVYMLSMPISIYYESMPVILNLFTMLINVLLILYD